MPKILIVENLEDTLVERLSNHWRRKGYEVEYWANLTNEGIQKILSNEQQQVDAIIVRDREVSRPIIDSWAHYNFPKSIICIGTNTAVIDTEAALAQGVTVTTFGLNDLSTSPPNSATSYMERLSSLSQQNSSAYVLSGQSSGQQKPKRILVADPLGENVVENFNRRIPNYTVTFNPKLDERALSETLATGEYDALIVGSRHIGETTLTAWRHANPHKELCLVRAGSDYSHIDLWAAAEQNIVVMNTPGANKDVISSYILNRLPEDGHGKTLAVIGYGAIGKDVVREAHSRGFTVKVYSPHLTYNPAEGAFTAMESVAEALRDADYVSITTPLITTEMAEKTNKALGQNYLKASYHSIDADALDALRSGAHIIMPSRPDVIDTTALTRALFTGKVAKLYLNTTAADIDTLRKSQPLLLEDHTDEIAPSANFLTTRAKDQMIVDALGRVVGYFSLGEVRNPVFPLKERKDQEKAQNTKRTSSPSSHVSVVRSLKRDNSPTIPDTADLFREDNLIIESIAIPGIGKVFMTYENESTPEKYAYSGVRVLSPMDDEKAIENAKRLSLTSSSWKNWLINHAVQEGALAHLSEEARAALPVSVWEKREIYGGRVVIIPEAGSYKDTGIAIETILKDANHALFTEVSAPIYSAIGARLNSLGGKMKVTPDFGPNASTADIMHEHTEHVLGISAEHNGSGGKSEYSITSIITALKKLHIEESDKDSPITLIGAAGALGSGVQHYLAAQGFRNVVLCDLQYDPNTPPAGLPEGWRITKAESGKFTDACLERSGSGSWVITTAYGDEMLASHHEKMQPGTIWIGAQNKDLPEGEAGIQFARQLKARGVQHIPGQVLTIGGTTASWAEHCTRAEEGRKFSKPAAHEVVSRVTEKIVDHMVTASRQKDTTPYEAMLDYANKKHWQTPSHVSELNDQARSTASLGTPGRK